MHPAEPTKEQSLCLSCGLCCNGTLYGKAPLKPTDDLERVEKNGIKVLTKGDKKIF